MFAVLIALTLGDASTAQTVICDCDGMLGLVFTTHFFTPVVFAKWQL